jgi:hypothetical protein
VTEEPALESRAELLKRVPMTLFSTSGTLRLQDGRLSFRTLERREVVFDAPVQEFHSVSAMTSRGFHIWRGSTRYRVSVGAPVGGPMTGITNVVDAVIALASLPHAQANDAENQLTSTRWLRLLAPLVGSPPADLKVRPPWPFWAWPLGIAAGAIGFAAALVLGAIAIR